MERRATRRGALLLFAAGCATEGSLREAPVVVSPAPGAAADGRRAVRGDLARALVEIESAADSEPFELRIPAGAKTLTYRRLAFETTPTARATWTLAFDGHRRVLRALYEARTRDGWAPSIRAAWAGRPISAGEIDLRLVAWNGNRWIRGEELPPPRPSFTLRCQRRMIDALVPSATLTSGACTDGGLDGVERPFWHPSVKTRVVAAYCTTGEARDDDWFASIELAEGAGIERIDRKDACGQYVAAYRRLSQDATFDERE